MKQNIRLWWKCSRDVCGIKVYLELSQTASTTEMERLFLDRKKIYTEVHSSYLLRMELAKKQTSAACR